jgi:hypothetical protein
VGRQWCPSTDKFNIGAFGGPYLFPIQNAYLGQLKAVFGDAVNVGTGGGVYTWEQIVQRIMLGGQVVQLCSTIYENGPKIIQQSLSAISAYMDEHGYATLADFRGLGLASGITPTAEDPAVYRPVVARIKDRAALATRAEELVQRVSGDCLAMRLGSDGIPVIDEHLCTGCGWCVYQAGDAIELVETVEFLHPHHLPRISLS